MTRQTPTAEFASLVYGRAGVALDDPAEAFHEASRLYPNVAPDRLDTLHELASSGELRETTARSSRTHDHRPGVGLACGRPLPSIGLAEAIRARRSRLDREHRPLELADLAVILAASYRAHDVPDLGSRRPVPSAGGLYPLELYPIALAVDGLDPAVYHYNPFRHRLERLAPIGRRDVAAALVDGSLGEGLAVLLVVTATIWRSRFKYGQRGFRFALLEAGHLAQNGLLAAAALGVQALPLGGFYDRHVDRLVGADGLDEATVYAIAIGGRE